MGRSKSDREIIDEVTSLPDFSQLPKEERERIIAMAQRRLLVQRRKLELLSADRCANSLEQFVREAWSILYGKRELHWNWHLSVGCGLLTEMKQGNIHRLLMCWPPRTLKSNIVSVFYPPFVWSNMPEHQFISLSHKAGLAERDAGRSRRLMSTDWYLKRWGENFHFAVDQNAKNRYVNSEGGHRISQGVGSGVIGEDADTVIVDDPSDPKKLINEKSREKINEEIWPDIQLRLNNQMTGNIIVMLQRIHEGDLAGHVIDTDSRNEFIKCIFPLEYEIDHPTPCKFDIRKREGEILDKERFPRDYIDALKSRTNMYIYSGRFQQRPSLRGGNILMREWWNTWTETDLPVFEMIIISFDTAFKEGQENDYTACTVWGLWKTSPKAKKYSMMLAGAWRDRVRYGTMKARAIATIEKWTIDDQPPDHIIIEDKASGQSLIQDFQDAGIDCFVYNPGGESLQFRANVISDVLEDGQIWVPGKPLPNGGRSDKMLATWAEPVVRECERFPKDEHDDYVASAIQAWHFAADNNYIESSLDLPLYEMDGPAGGKKAATESIY